MTHRILYAIIFVEIIFSKVAYSLEYREKLKANIVNFSGNKNRIIINRGIEDGIQVGDNASFSIKDNFLCRAVAIVTRLSLSEWVLYRVYEKNFISLNASVDLVSLSVPFEKSQIKNYHSLRQNSLLVSIYEKAKQEYIAKREDEIKKEEIKRLDQKYRIKEYKEFTLPDLRFKLKASPISFRSPHKEKLISYGIDVQNLNQEEYVFNSRYQYSTISFTFNSKGDTYSTGQYLFQTTLDKKKFWRNFDRTSLIELKREREGIIRPIQYQIDIGPFGMKYTFKPFAKFKNISLGYTPLIEFFAGDVKQNNEIIQSKEIYTRHAFSFSFLLDVTSQVKVTNHFNVRPYHNINKGDLDLKNSDLLNNFSLRYEIFPQFALAYQSNYSWDIRRKRNLGNPSSEWENSFYLFYSIDIKDQKI